MSLLAIASLVTGLYVFRLVRQRRTPSLGHLDGPQTHHWFFGNLKSLFQTSRILVDWIDDYGKAFAINGPFWTKQLYTADPRAIAYCLQSPRTFTKTWSPQDGVSRTPYHHMQHRLLHISLQHIRKDDILAMVLNESYALSRRLTYADGASVPRLPINVDVLRETNLTSLSMLGRLAFNRPINAAGGAVFTPASDVQSISQSVIPALRHLSFEDYHGRIFTQQVVRTFAEEVKSNQELELDAAQASPKDFFNALLQTNYSMECEGSRMPYEDIASHVLRTAVDGCSLVSATMAWTLYALADAPHVQRKLRESLSSLNGKPSAEELEGCKYLDMVVRECLRVHPPVDFVTVRARKAEAIPLSGPILSKYARVLSRVPVHSGDVIQLHLREFNLLKNLWGDACHEFRPERWEQPFCCGPVQPFYPSDTASLLYESPLGGGSPFAVLMLKAFLVTLVRNFEIRLPHYIKIARLIGDDGIARPAILGDEGKRPQLPMILFPLKV